MNRARVIIVFDVDFGENLIEIAERSPIWIVESAANKASAQQLWARKVGDVTTFRPAEFAEVIGIIDEHHPGWQEIEVHGIAYTPAIQAELECLGARDLAEMPDGFTFHRRHEPAN